MNNPFVGIAIALCLSMTSAQAAEAGNAAPLSQAPENLEGDYLYKVTMVRAAPGKLSALLDWHAAMKASGYCQASDDAAPFLMRHSQGDQWDLLVITPMEGWYSYYMPRRGELRAAAVKKVRELYHQSDDLIQSSEDLFARGPDIADFKREVAGKGLFHVEMFHALAGRHGDLYRQRQMENEYLLATGQTANMIFSVEAGGDVDVFTIGAHQSLEAFATPTVIGDEEKEAAAKAAGFKNRADISFLLRALIVYHNDTLAVSVD